MSARWLAKITYRTDSGPVDVEHPLVELGSIHNIVELGPHWDTIIDIHITRTDAADLTVERAAQI